MRVEWGMACRTLRLQNGEASAEGLAVDTLVIPGLPADVELVALLRIACTADECESEHPFECYLMAPEMSSVESLHFDLNVPAPSPEHPEGWEIKTFLPVVSRFRAEREGPYSLDVYIDGRYRWSVPFRVLTRGP